MALRKKFDLKRFKNGMSGLIEFATIIEQTDPVHRERFLKEAREQDPMFFGQAMRKAIFFDELIYLDETILAEIMFKVSAKVMVYALHESTEDFKKKMLGFLSYQELRKMRDEQEKMEEVVAHGLVLGAQRQVLKMARSLEREGKIVFELTDCPRFQKAAPKKRKAS